jgi:hypothetical protein
MSSALWNDLRHGETRIMSKNKNHFVDKGISKVIWENTDNNEEYTGISKKMDRARGALNNSGRYDGNSETTDPWQSQRKMIDSWVQIRYSIRRIDFL